MALLTSVFIASCSLKSTRCVDAGGLRVRVGFGDAHRIDVDAEAAGAVFLRGRDRDPAVAAAQIDDQVVFCDPGQAQHSVDDVLRRRHVGRQLRRIGPFASVSERLGWLLTESDGQSSAVIVRPCAEADHGLSISKTVLTVRGIRG